VDKGKAKSQLFPWLLGSY